MGPISVMTANGRSQWIVPTVTANSLDSSRRGPIPNSSSSELSGPVLPSTATQAYARTIVCTKNITITEKRSARRIRADLERAIV